MAISRSKIGIRHVLIVIGLMAVTMMLFIWHNTASFGAASGEKRSPPPINKAVSQKSTSPVLEQVPVVPHVTINGTTIIVELATTTTAVQKGLSGRLSLAPDSGMLFLFSIPAIYHFWMPDMHFPIDIIWMNKAGTVVDISANVSATFDPAAPKFYTPKHPAQYIIEVNAGFAAAHGITVGDRTVFKNIPQLP